MIYKFDDINGCLKVYEVIIKGKLILKLGVLEFFWVFVKEL